ncbi:MAG TPA: imidazolonepropionase [Feifaniaceae bacterium]|nr:imidazolonepropionase [Feifaniaceae bacterium]
MLLIKNIGLLQTPVGAMSARGEAQAHNLKIKNAAILIDGGIIKAVFEGGELPFCDKSVDTLDAEGRLATPGWIDCHTHLVFGGWRQHEVPLKLSGAGYLEILRAGGGILDTVRHTREASEDALYEKSRVFLNEMLAYGVTAAEGKSGYGLDLENELKQLRVMKRLNETQPVEVVPTFMGAHAVPEEYAGDGDGYIEYLCSIVLPKIKEEGLARFADVFCEDSVFNVEQSRRYLKAAQALGLGLKIHADEIEEIGGARLAGELHAVSAEHLIATGEKGMEALAAGNVTAVLLPQTSFCLNKPFAEARRMMERNIPVAIASDFNPGSSPSLNLQFAVNLGYLKYRMQPSEVLTAVTLNAACAIGLGNRLGTIEPGKQADIVLWDAPDMEMLCYRFGSNLAHTVIKKGEIHVKRA